MKILMKTPRHQIIQDEKGQLYFYNVDLKLSISELNFFKKNDYILGMPFNRIPEKYFENLNEIKNFSITNDFVIGVTFDQYNLDVINDFRKTFKISKFLYVIEFYDKEGKFKNKGLILDRHNFFNFGDPINCTITTYLKKNKIELEKKEKIQQEARRLFFNDIYEKKKGWYIVVVTADCFMKRGNDRSLDYSFKILGESKQDAFEKATNKLNENLTDKHGNTIYNIHGIESALIEYKGLWTDEDENELAP